VSLDLRSHRWTLGIMMTGILFVFLSTCMSESKTTGSERGRLEKNVVTAALSFGHREFAWTLLALEGLASTVNLWHAENSTNTDKATQIQMERRFYSFIKTLPEFAKEKIGMHEIFLFPSSYLAFVRNDIDNAVDVARAGSTDARLRANLVLTVAYLTHIFKDDLNSIADEYEKVAAEYPQATWLRKTINKLRSGQDPFLEEKTSKNCERFLNIFPFSKAQLIKRGICPTPDNEGKNSHE
jgi:hypothetical protein